MSVEILSYVGVWEHKKQKTGQNNMLKRMVSSCAQLEVTLMHLIHNADDEFQRTGKSIQFELIAVQTQQCKLEKKQNPVAQK